MTKAKFITGPLATTVAASDWGLYFEGVFDGCDYNENIEVNHQGILILKQSTERTNNRVEIRFMYSFFTA